VKCVSDPTNIVDIVSDDRVLRGGEVRSNGHERREWLLLLDCLENKRLRGVLPECTTSRSIARGTRCFGICRSPLGRSKEVRRIDGKQGPSPERTPKRQRRPDGEFRISVNFQSFTCRPEAVLSTVGGSGLKRKAA
jgi:hypothetical protein